jgi:WD40-like Beta Propeller Repeat
MSMRFRPMRQRLGLIGWAIVWMLAGCSRSGYERIDPGQAFTFANSAWSPDGKKIAFSVFYEKLYLADVAATRAK